MSSPSGGAAGAPGQTSYQETLNNFCRSRGLRAPNFQIISDRRGGRTAWSCVVTVQGAQGNQQPVQVPARFWYDGQYVNNAREDAAEKALQMLGVIPTTNTQQPGHPPQRGGRFHGAING